MPSRWKWFLGGALCGGLATLVALSLVAVVTMRIDWSHLPGAPKIPEEGVTWEVREEGRGRSHRQVDSTGQPHGLFRHFADDGRLVAEGQHFRSGQDGHWVWWAPDGSWVAVGGFLDGREHGTWIVWEAAAWLEQPVDLAVISYDRGVKQGPLTAWREDGTLDPMVTGWYEADARVRDLEPFELHRPPGS